MSWKREIKFWKAELSDRTTLVLAGLLIGIVVGILMAIFAAHGARAGDYGRAAGAIANTPEQRAWYSRLMRPDAPASSCCGEGEAYWADESHWEGGEMYAVITDDRPDCLPKTSELEVVVCRAHEEVGTRYVVPAARIVGVQSHGNPTGHVIVFLSAPTYRQEGGMSPRAVICYIMNGGI